MFYCRYCLHGFIREDLLPDHEPHCCRYGVQRIELLSEDNASLYFKDYHKQLKRQNSNTSKKNLVSSSRCASRTKKNRCFKMPLTVICGFELGADRVRDHCHLTGKYRGAAHNECNLNYSFTGRIPVILHSLRGYDSHLIMQGLGKLKNKEINCIPNNIEKYISFSIDKLDFIDSLQFMDASLERLVSNLSKSGADMFPISRNTLKLKEYHCFCGKAYIRMTTWIVWKSLIKKLCLLKNASTVF
ncbi:Gastrula zinc finger [Paramuricea clavata]|uniref:Gastrula zinc finger n=1 Tax=Paramuricea clavata TaxID=317549 RepID=A0A6S7LRN2_PARCT|nr:Gastrula zinc finger [Paramuricea clavata]